MHHASTPRSRAAVAPAAGGLLAASLLLAGCAVGGPSIAAIPVPTGPHQLSALPITQYELTAAQQTALFKTEANLVSSCMRSLGIDYKLPPGTPSAADADPSGDLPDNDPALAAVQGYRDRSAATAQAAHQQQSETGAPISAQTRTALLGTSTPGNSTGGCLGQARHAIAGPASGDPDAVFGTSQLVSDIRLDSYFAALSDPRVGAAFAAWSACMKAKGFDYPTPVAAVDDKRWNALQPPTDLEIRTATADVACNYQHNVAGIFHVAQVTQENKEIEANRGALRAIRAGLDRALATAARIDAQTPPAGT